MIYRNKQIFSFTNYHHNYEKMHGAFKQDWYSLGNCQIAACSMLYHYCCTEIAFILDPITKSGHTLLGLAVRQGRLDIIKYLVTETEVKVNGIM